MKADNKSKTKTLLLGISKILLAAYALIKRMLESSLIKSQKLVHGHAAYSRSTAWFVPTDKVILSTSCRQWQWGD